MVMQYLAKWNVMDGNEIIFTGTNEEIRKRFGMYKCFAASQYYQRGVKIKRKYSIVPTTETAKRKKTRYDVPYDDVLRMMRINHNCFVRYDAENVVARLKADGINAEIRPTMDRVGCILWEA